MHTQESPALAGDSCVCRKDSTPVIARQCRSTGVAIRPPETLPSTEISAGRREYGLPHQRVRWFAMTKTEDLYAKKSGRIRYHHTMDWKRLIVTGTIVGLEGHSVVLREIDFLIQIAKVNLGILLRRPAITAAIIPDRTSRPFFNHRTVEVNRDGTSGSALQASEYDFYAFFYSVYLFITITIGFTFKIFASDTSRNYNIFLHAACAAGWTLIVEVCNDMC